MTDLGTQKSPHFALRRPAPLGLEYGLLEHRPVGDRQRTDQLHAGYLSGLGIGCSETRTGHRPDSGHAATGRTAAPGRAVLIGRIADRKTFCLGTFLLSGLLLFCLPIMAAPGMLRSAAISLAALVILWSLHHLMQYLGTVALFSWLADIAPLRIRGRFFGYRQRWLVAGEAVGALACGLFSYWWIAQSRQVAGMDRLCDSRRPGGVVHDCGDNAAMADAQCFSISLWERAG